MLQMNCSNCGSLIKSPHLVEVQLFLCPSCEEIVVVEKVVISKPKSSNKLYSSLKNLLLSAKGKFQLNKSSDSNLQTKYEIDRRLAKFLRRDDFRLNIAHDSFVQTTFGDHQRSAKLLNISSTGAAIEFVELDPLPEDNPETKLHLLLPGQPEPLQVLAGVVWSGKLAKAEGPPTITIGLQFIDIDEETRAGLWDFIIKNETTDSTNSCL